MDMNEVYELSRRKTVETSGASESTPSFAQYFSWISSTNEGSTEEQTLANLGYFKWLKETYGAQIDIYAWDAGNLDGASGTYEFPDGEKLSAQYPRGYGPIAEAAAELGCRLGVWCGADGFGDTPEEEKARYDLMVSLCRDYRFGLFKIDTVCGQLRPEKRAVFMKMINECRKYSPNLILLNHRNQLGEAAIVATTFLWNGQETYIDVLMSNTMTAPHHRAGSMARGLVPELLRLTEDHGVCLSSCLDNFTDELVLHAFGRSLILSPEVYGNPWLLRDDEHRLLARIYTLHAEYNDILVNGMLLPEEKYGDCAVSRGDGRHRFITLRRLDWKSFTVPIKLDGEIGLESCKKVAVAARFPEEKFLGCFEYGDIVDIEVLPFRSALIEVCDAELFDRDAFERGKVFDCAEAPPVKLTSAVPVGLPADAESLYEATAFAADCDSLEAQSRRRAGETSIPAVKAARDAFFNQKTYRYRGCENAAMFDGREDTWYDAVSRHYQDKTTRIGGGCLRLDIGGIVDAAALEITFFEPNEPIREMPPQFVTAAGEYSTDRANWKPSPLTGVYDTKPITAPAVKSRVHNIVDVPGMLRKAVYKVGSLAYFRIAEPLDRIYSIKLFDEKGNEIPLPAPRANNLLAHFGRTGLAYAMTADIPAGLKEGDVIAAAVEGEHGPEGAYAAIKSCGHYIGAFDRAASYPCNQWEHRVEPVNTGYTYYFRVDADLAREGGQIYLLSKGTGLNCDIYLLAK